MTATSGTTTEVVIEPRTETPSPTQSSRKLRLPLIGGAVAGRPVRAERAAKAHGVRGAGIRSHGWLGKPRENT